MTVGYKEQAEKFITTEPLRTDGGSEQQIWDVVREAFSDRNCIAYWRYPIFSELDQKQPDILIVDRQLGLVVIEIKTLKIDKIHVETRNFASLQSAEDQLRSLIARSGEISTKITGRAIIALPSITSSQWQQKGGAILTNYPTIIFQDQLTKHSLLACIQQSLPLIPGLDLNETDWNLLLSQRCGKLSSI